MLRHLQAAHPLAFPDDRKFGRTLERRVLRSGGLCLYRSRRRDMSSSAKTAASRGYIKGQSDHHHADELGRE